LENKRLCIPERFLDIEDTIRLPFRPGNTCSQYQVSGCECSAQCREFDFLFGVTCSGFFTDAVLGLSLCTQRPASEDLKRMLFRPVTDSSTDDLVRLVRGEMVPVDRLAVSTLTAFCPNPHAGGLRGEVVFNLLGVSFKEHNDTLQSMDGSSSWPSSPIEFSGPVFVLFWHWVRFRSLGLSPT
jgi:hypothetical protein